MGDALWPLRHHTKRSADYTTYYINLHNAPNYDNNAGFNIQKVRRHGQEETAKTTHSPLQAFKLTLLAEKADTAATS